ncbi:MAG: sugar phosphate isomerase/epimerase [Bacilli bacterium]|nr:sugar phosphate isomerase/epimerase [Bacilli bacterium]
MKQYIFLEYGFPSSREEKVKLIKQYGFDGVFLEWKDNLKDIASIVRGADLDIQTVHLPFDTANSLWEDTPEGEQYCHQIIQGIKDTGEIGVKIAIVHTSRGMNPPELSQIGLNRIKKMLKACEESGVIIALENIRRLEYLDYIFDNIDSPFLKYCFDSGHANCFSKNIENYPWEKYQEKLVCVHLHDNSGEGDQHKMPYEGNIDWQKLMTRFKEIGYHGPLTLEVVQKNCDGLDEEKFIEKAREILNKLESMLYVK